MPKILVVDDEKNILELVRFNLEREGYEVLTSWTAPGVSNWPAAKIRI